MIEYQIRLTVLHAHPGLLTLSVIDEVLWCQRNGCIGNALCCDIEVLAGCCLTIVIALTCNGDGVFAHLGSALVSEGVVLIEYQILITVLHAYLRFLVLSVIDEALC